MPTIKNRTNVTMSKDLDEAVVYLAKRDQVPKATKAVELIELAVRIEEDELWDKLANKRDKEGAKFVSHKDAWS